MIDLQAILVEYPADLRNFQEAILREYIQHQILDIIFTSPLAKDVVFLGGTALRIGYGNSRFSEDLDFDNLSLDNDKLLTLSKLLTTKLESRGLVNTINIKAQKGRRLKIRFTDLLYPLGLSPHKDARAMIHVDLAAQNFAYSPAIFKLNKFDLSTAIPLVSKELLLAQKLVTAFNRPRAKGRDFYDIAFLIESGIEPEFAYLEQRLQINSWSDLKTYLLRELTKQNLNVLAKDVAPFLFDPGDQRRVVDLRERLNVWLSKRE